MTKNEITKNNAFYLFIYLFPKTTKKDLQHISSLSCNSYV